LKKVYHQDELVSRCRKGDRSAQFQLYDKYAKAMYNIAYRMVQNEGDAQDVLQNSFVDVFTKLDRFRNESTIGAWIKRIVINNSINHIKKKRINTEWLDEKMDVIPEVYEKDDLNYTVAGIKKVVAKLPEGYRVIFSMYAFEGYDHNEISEILGISLSTSKSQYSRAKQKIRDQFTRDKI